MGRPSARPHLIAGCGEDEEDAEGSFVWSAGEASTLAFFAVEPADFTLGLHCQPLVFEGAPDQTVDPVRVDVKVLFFDKINGEVREAM